MAIWTNTMSMPVGQTGFAIQNQLGTGIKIQPIDPRAFAGGSSTGGGSRAGSGTSSKDSDKDYKAPSGIKHDISMAERMLYNAGLALESKYLKMMTEEGVSDTRLKELQNEYLSERANLQLQKMNMATLKNQAVLQGDALNKGIEQSKNIEGEIAFNVPVGSAMRGEDLMNLSIDKNGQLMNLTSISGDKNKKDFRLLTIRDYWNEYDKNSGLTSDGVTELKYPELNMDNPISFQTNLNNALGQAGKEDLFKSIGEAMSSNKDMFSNSYLNSLLDTDYQTMLKVGTNENNLVDIVNNMWEKLGDSSRSYAISHVLKTGVTIKTDEMVRNDLRWEDGTLLTDEELIEKGEPLTRNAYRKITGKDAMALYQKNYYDYVAMMSSDDPDKDAKAEAIKKEVLRYADGVMNSAKEYVVARATGNVIGRTQSDVVMAPEGMPGIGQQNSATYMEALLNNVTPNPRTSALTYDPLRFNKEFAFTDLKSGGYVVIPSEIRPNILKDFNWEFNNPNVAKPKVTEVDMIMINGVPMSTDQYLDEDGIPLEIVNMGNRINIFPDYEAEVVDAQKYPGMYGRTTGFTKGYIEVTMKVDDDTPIPVQDGDGVAIKKFKDIKNTKKNDGTEMYPSLNINRDAETITVSVPAPHEMLGDSKGYNVKKQAEMYRLKQDKIRERKQNEAKQMQQVAEQKTQIISDWVEKYKRPDAETSAFNSVNMEYFLRTGNTIGGQKFDDIIKSLESIGVIQPLSKGGQTIANNIFLLKILQQSIGYSPGIDRIVDYYKQLNSYWAYRPDMERTASHFSID